MIKRPQDDDLVELFESGLDPGVEKNGDLTLEELTRLHAKKFPEPKELVVAVTDDGYVQVGNDLKQMYYKLTPVETTKHISLLMEARQKAFAIRKARGE